MKQLTGRINGLKKISRNATYNTRLMVANGVVMSKLVYLITVCGGAQQYLLNGLQVQQLTAARHSGVTEPIAPLLRFLTFF